MSTSREAVSAAGLAELELAIGGMTCASCANRVERKLNKLDGVTATVNYATEKAKVTFGDEVEPATLVDAVAKGGPEAEEKLSEANAAIARLVRA